MTFGFLGLITEARCGGDAHESISGIATHCLPGGGPPPPATQRYQAIPRADESALTHAVVELANLYGRYGYRTVTGLLQLQGWDIQHGRVWRIWKAEGLKVPHKQKPRGRLFLNDGSCIRLRPQYRNHVWSYDFVSCQTHDGRKFRVLVLLDEHTSECLSLVVARLLFCIEN